MAFVPFGEQDFELMKLVQKNSIPPQLEDKINELRQDLGGFPESQLGFFSKRIVRRPNMRGDNYSGGISTEMEQQPSLVTWVGLRSTANAELRRASGSSRSSGWRKKLGGKN